MRAPHRRLGVCSFQLLLCMMQHCPLWRTSNKAPSWKQKAAPADTSADLVLDSQPPNPLLLSINYPVSVILYSGQTKTESNQSPVLWTGGVVQTIERLLCKCVALTSNPSSTNQPTNKQVPLHSIRHLLPQPAQGLERG
jgi:hypothetical protein